jgi:hypothetical protein
MPNLKIYQFAVILQPKQNKDGEVTEDGQLVVQLQTVLAATDEQAQLLAGRAIPEEYLDKIDRLTVAVRPF